MVSQYTDVRKIAICVFNRATYSRCKYLIHILDRDESFDVHVLASGAIASKDYGDHSYISKDVKKLKIVNVGTTQVSDNMSICKISAQILHKFSDEFARIEPDAAIVVGDRFETLPAAMAASYMNIPLIHVQGGEVTGNIDEKVRHSVTKLADYHFVSTEMSKKYVIRMGEEKMRVFNLGCPSLEVVRRGHIRRWTPKERYMFCIFHPETGNEQENLRQVQDCIEATVEFSAKNNMKIYWYWPNPDPGRMKMIQMLDDAKSAFWEFFHKADNHPPEEFLRKLAGARFVIGNSSVGLREASFLGVPAINIGDRQNLRERSWNVIDCHPVKDSMLRAMLIQMNVDRHRYKRSRLYGDGRASEYILRALRGIEFTKKEALTYPTQMEFATDHLGEKRFVKHRKKRDKKPSRKARKQVRNDGEYSSTGEIGAGVS